MSQVPRQESRPNGLNALLEPGEAEPRLENFLSNFEGDFSEEIVVPPLQDKRCALCTITDYPYNQGEVVFEENDDFYIVETEDMKGHERRNMLVLTDHDRFPGDEDFSRYAAEGLESLVDYTFEGGPVAVYAGNNTFHHPHIVVSDLQPEDVEDSKLSEVNNYLVFDSPDSLDEPVYEEYGDLVGEAFLQRFYRAAVEDL